LSEVYSVVRTVQFRTPLKWNDKIKDYRDLVNYFIDYGLKNNVTSYKRLRQENYDYLRREYSDFPSHYIHTSAQIASGLLKSHRRLLRMWKKGEIEEKPSRPIFKKLGVLLDETTFSYRIEDDEIEFSLNYFGERIKFRRKIHKHLKKYLNQGYRISRQPILKPRKGKIYLLLPLKKDVKVKECKNVLTVDVNLNNVTWFNSGKIKQVLTFEQRIRTAYYLKYRRMQLKITKLEKRKRVYRKYKERHKNCIKDIYYKIANEIVDDSERTNSVIVMEDLTGIRDSIDYGSKLNGILHKWSFRRFQIILEEKAKERGIPVLKVNPSNTSSLCPMCGAKLTPNGYRLLKCSCGFEGDRDCVAVLNLARRCGESPFPPKANADEGLRIYPDEVWSVGRFSVANKQKRLLKLAVKYYDVLRRTRTELINYLAQNGFSFLFISKNSFNAFFVLSLRTSNNSLSNILA